MYITYLLLYSKLSENSGFKWYVHEGALMQKTNKQTNPKTACAKALRKERPTWVCCNDWWNLASMQMQSEPLS